MIAAGSQHSGTALVVDGLVGGYGSSEILHGVSLEVRLGQAVGILGPNGAGKTTLCNALAGVLRTREGSVSLFGERIDHKNAAHRVRRGLVLVPEGRHVFAQVSVAENLRLGGFAVGGASDEVLDIVFDVFPPLRRCLKQRAGTLSGGEQQMLAIARGLVAKPKLLMIDEPSMGLAPVLIDSLVEQLAGIREQLGLTMLIVEQGMTLAADVCERIYVMTGGRIVAEVDSNVSAKEVLELYMGSAAMAADATAQSRSKSRVEEVGA